MHFRKCKMLASYLLGSPPLNSTENTWKPKSAKENVNKNHRLYKVNFVLFLANRLFSKRSDFLKTFRYKDLRKKFLKNGWEYTTFRRSSSDVIIKWKETVWISYKYRKNNISLIKKKLRFLTLMESLSVFRPQFFDA